MTPVSAVRSREMDGPSSNRGPERRSAVFESRTAELRRMSAWFREFAREAGMPPERAFDVELCLNELMSNVIRHAYDDNETRRLLVTLEHVPGTLRAVLEDDGRPFDPTSAPAPSPLAALPSDRTGGWGIPIVRAFASDVGYERSEGRNRVSIEFRTEEPLMR